MSRSKFPAEIDSFPILTDITIADVVNIRRYKELREKSSLTASEQAELNALITNLTTAGKLITAEYHNKVTDSIVAIQTFFKDNVDGYIKQKQEEFDRILQQFSDKGNWSPEITYQQWNTVVYNHETYLSRKNNNLNHIPDEENSEWWHKVAQRGKQGPPGVGLTFLGNYDDSVLYNPGSAVYYENVIWYAMNPTQGNKPEAGSPYWTVFLANSGVVIDSNPPAAPYTGQIYVDVSNLNYPKIKYWTGTQWSEIGTSANKVTITDVGNYFDSNNVEGALQELGSKQKQIENNFSKVFVADGTANAITVTTGFFNLKDGQSFTFIAKYDNNGATTTINADGKGARNVYKPNTTTTPTFIAGKAYTVWYDASKSCFFIKASAEGNATADSVLAGRTFSNDEDTGLVGTMPDQSGKTVSSAGFTRDGTTIKVKLQKGYYDTSSQVTISDPDFVADNIRAGKEIFGINGTFTSDSNATAAHVLEGYKVGIKGEMVEGTMPNHGSKIFTPSRNIQTGTSGYYSSITVNPIPSNYYGSGDSIPANQFSDYILPIKWMKIDTGYSSITGGRFVGNRIINYTGGSYSYIVYSYDPDTGDYVSASLNSYNNIVAISMIDGMSSGALVYTSSLGDYYLARVSVSTTSISIGSDWMGSSSYIYTAPCDRYIYYAIRYTSGESTYYRYGRASSSSSRTILFEKSFSPAGRLRNFYADHTDGVLFVSVAGNHNKIYKFDFSGNILASLNYTGNFMAMEIDVVNNHLYVCDGNTLKKMDYNFSTIWSISVSNMGISDDINTSSLRYFYKIGDKIYLNNYIFNADNGNILYDPSNETITLPPGMSGSPSILVAPDLSYKIISGPFGTVRLLNAIKLK